MKSVDLDSRFPRIAERLEREAHLATERAARSTAERARARIPVRTGKTQSTIRVMGRAVTGPASFKRRVRVKFPGPLLEHGTKNMRAQPYLVPAAKDAHERMLRDVARWFR